MLVICPWVCVCCWRFDFFSLIEYGRNKVSPQTTNDAHYCLHIARRQILRQSLFRQSHRVICDKCPVEVLSYTARLVIVIISVHLFIHFILELPSVRLNIIHCTWKKREINHLMRINTYVHVKSAAEEPCTSISEHLFFHYC